MKYYRTLTYGYSCNTCKSTKVKIIDQCTTEKFGVVYIDQQGDQHYHDSNSGTVTYVCDSGHKTETKYIPACECGWNGNKPDPRLSNLINLN